jgi:hypothetical protein
MVLQGQPKLTIGKLAEALRLPINLLYTGTIKQQFRDI